MDHFFTQQHLYCLHPKVKLYLMQKVKSNCSLTTKADPYSTLRTTASQLSFAGRQMIVRTYCEQEAVMVTWTHSDGLHFPRRLLGNQNTPKKRKEKKNREKSRTAEVFGQLGKARQESLFSQLLLESSLCPAPRQFT